MKGNDTIAVIVGGLTAFGLVCWGLSAWHLRYLKSCAEKVKAEQDRQETIRIANIAARAPVPIAPRNPPRRVHFAPSRDARPPRTSRPRTSPQSTDTSDLTDTSSASWKMRMVQSYSKTLSKTPVVFTTFSSHRLEATPFGLSFVHPSQLRFHPKNLLDSDINEERIWPFIITHHRSFVHHQSPA